MFDVFQWPDSVVIGHNYMEYTSQRKKKISSFFNILNICILQQQHNINFNIYTQMEERDYFLTREWIFSTN